jgi:hypothetical protein
MAMTPWTARQAPCDALRASTLFGNGCERRSTGQVNRKGDFDIAASNSAQGSERRKALVLSLSADLSPVGAGEFLGEEDELVANRGALDLCERLGEG